MLQISSGAAATLLVVALVLTCARFAQHPSLRRQGWFWGRCWSRCSRTANRFSFTPAAGWTPCWPRWPTPSWSTRRSRSRRLRRSRRARRDRSRRVPRVSGQARQRALRVVRSTALPHVEPASRRRRRPLLAFAATLTALVAIDLLFKIAYLGTPRSARRLGQTPVATTGGFAGEYTWNPLWFLSVFVAGLWAFIVALILFTTRAERARRCWRCCRWWPSPSPLSSTSTRSWAISDGSIFRRCPSSSWPPR